MQIDRQTVDLLVAKLQQAKAGIKGHIEAMEMVGLDPQKTLLYLDVARINDVEMALRRLRGDFKEV